MLSPQLFSAHAQMRESKFSVVGLTASYRERELSSGRLFHDLDTFPFSLPTPESKNPLDCTDSGFVCLSVGLFIRH